MPKGALFGARRTHPYQPGATPRDLGRKKLQPERLLHTAASASILRGAPNRAGLQPATVTYTNTQGAVWAGMGLRLRPRGANRRRRQTGVVDTPDGYRAPSARGQSSTLNRGSPEVFRLFPEIRQSARSSDKEQGADYPATPRLDASLILSPANTLYLGAAES